MADMNIHRAGINVRAGAPHNLNQMAAWQQHADSAKEIQRKLGLLFSQLDRFAIQLEPAVTEISPVAAESGAGLWRAEG